MPQNLPGAKIVEISKALQTVYPDWVRFSLALLTLNVDAGDRQMPGINYADNLTLIIRDADVEGWLPRLVDVAVTRAPNDQALRDIQAFLNHQTGKTSFVPPATVLTPCDVLVLGAQLAQLGPLNVAMEVERIRSELRRESAGHSSARSWTIQSIETAVIDDLTRYLLEARPEILHFSGHGTRGALLWPNAAGQLRPLQPRVLAKAVQVAGVRLRCAIFNACQSKAQAKAFAPFCEGVVVMQKEISDNAAIQFSTGFYRGLAAGRSLREAYEFGRYQIELDEPEYADSPKFYPGHLRQAGETSEDESSKKQSSPPNGLETDTTRQEAALKRRARSNGIVLGEIARALRAAFATQKRFETFLSSHLDKQLADYASEAATYPDAISDVLTRANAELWLNDLVQKASAQVPGDSTLAVLAQRLGGEDLNDCTHNGPQAT